jgi:hypothetical protein
MAILAQILLQTSIDPRVFRKPQSILSPCRCSVRQKQTNSREAVKPHDH